MRAAVLTVSDGVVAGTREDSSGDLLTALLESDGYEVERRTVADEAGEIAAAIVELAEAANVVLTTGGTGVEMEALTAATVAALTVYDMAKAIDKEMVIAEVTLVEKTKEVV